MNRDGNCQLAGQFLAWFTIETSSRVTSFIPPNVYVDHFSVNLFMLYVFSVQHVRVTHSAVAVTDCVFRHVNCVMDTHNAVITVTKPTVLRITVRTYMI